MDETTQEATKPTYEDLESELFDTTSDEIDDDEQVSEETDTNTDIAGPDEGDEDDATADGAEPEAPEEDTLALDKAVREALPSELQERWDNHTRGLLKREAKLELREAEFETELNQAQTVVDWALRFEQRDTALETFRQLVEQMKQIHGYSDTELGLGRPAKQAHQGDDGYEEWDETDYADTGEAVKRAVEDARKQWEAQLAPYLGELKSLKEAREREAQQAQQNAYIDRIAPSTIKALSYEHRGWQVTRDMVAEAMRELGSLPKYKSDPVAAVEAYWHKELAKHLTAGAKAAKPRGPELPKPVTNRGKVRQTRPTFEELVDEVMAETGR